MAGLPRPQRRREESRHLGQLDPPRWLASRRRRRGGASLRRGHPRRVRAMLQQELTTRRRLRPFFPTPQDKGNEEPLGPRPPAPEIPPPWRAVWSPQDGQYFFWHPMEMRVWWAEPQLAKFSNASAPQAACRVSGQQTLQAVQSDYCTYCRSDSARQKERNI